MRGRLEKGMNSLKQVKEPWRKRRVLIEMEYIEPTEMYKERDTKDVEPGKGDLRIQE